MKTPDVHVSGEFRSGIIVTAARPTHLDPTNRHGPQIMVLTAGQAEALYYQLDQMHQKRRQNPRRLEGPTNDQ